MHVLGSPRRSPRADWPIRRSHLAHLARRALVAPPPASAQALATYLVLVRAVRPRWGGAACRGAARPGAPALRVAADFAVTMPDSTHPKTPSAEPHTETTPKESIRPAQEEFVGDEAQPSRDKSEYETDRGHQSSDRGVEDGQLSGADGGSQSTDRAVEDASLSNMATDVAEDEDDDLDDDDDEDEDDLGEDDEDLDGDEDEADATPGAASRVLVGA